MTYEDGTQQPNASASLPPAAPAATNRNLMIVLAYIWLLALIPLLVEKDDKEVQWHAKHGMVLLVAEIAVWVAYGILTMIPGVGCLLALLIPFIWLVFVVVRVLCIVKGLKGQRMLIPGLSTYADKF